MKITSKALTDLTKDEYRACHYLNMRGNGMMMYSLMGNRTNEDAHAIMAWEGPNLIGWALLIPHDDEPNWFSTRYQKSKSKYVTQFYVRKTRRNEGVGGLLMREVIKLDSTPTVIPHDATSADFFASYPIVTERCRRDLIQEAQWRKKRKLRVA